MDVDLLRRLAASGKIAFKRHTLLRMYQRKIASEDIREALQGCRIIEEYLSDRPLPSCLVLGYTRRNRPLHVVLALDEGDELIWVITVYEPGSESWKKGFQKRSQP